MTFFEAADRLLCRLICCGILRITVFKLRLILLSRATRRTQRRIQHALRKATGFNGYKP